MHVSLGTDSANELVRCASPSYEQVRRQCGLSATPQIAERTQLAVESGAPEGGTSRRIRVSLEFVGGLCLATAGPPAV
jgi:hypothetical protein